MGETLGRPSVSGADGGRDSREAQRRRWLEVVGWARDAESTSVQDMRIDLRGYDRGVAQQLLNGPDVVALPEQFCGEAVTLMPSSA